MRYVRKKSKCGDCALCDRERVWGIGNPSGLALFGEAPGRTEDALGKPFVGDAGRFLRWGLFAAEIPPNGIWLSNAYTCQPPRNVWDGPEGRDAQSKCRPGFEAEIAFLRKRGCKVIVPLGQNACRYFGLEGSIGKIRGSVYQWNGFIIIPTYHPSYLNRMYAPRKQDGAKTSFKGVWLADLKKAWTLHKEGWTAPEERFIFDPTEAQIKGWVDRALSTRSLIALDIETAYSREQREIVCIGMAVSEEDAIVIPCYKHHRKLAYPIPHLQLLLNPLFKNGRFMLQNALYDVPILQENGFTLPWKNVEHDIMLLHHSLSPELPHNLEFIVSVYGSTPYWKSTLKDNEGSIYDLEDHELWTYNARDNVVLHQVLPPMLEELEEIGTGEVYREESMGLLVPISRMTKNGMLVDESARKKFRRKYLKKKREKGEELRKLANLPEAFNLDSDTDLRWFLWRYKAKKFEAVTDLPKKKRKDTAIYKRLLGYKSILETKQFWNPQQHGVSPRTTKKGRIPKVDEQARLSLQVHAQNRLDLIKHFKRPRPIHMEEKAGIENLLRWLALYNDYATLSKLVSTYTKFPVWEDGRIHPGFLIHGTATGRLSSSKPNFQNFPKRDEVAKDVRKAFIASPGYVLLSGDYSNLEVWVLAYESNDTILLQTLFSGKNIHDENTRTLFELKKGHPLWDTGRFAAKIFQFGKIQYAGGDREVYEQVILNAPGLNLTFSHFKEAIENYFKAHPAYEEWYSKIEAESKRDNPVATTFMGRKRFLTGAPRDLLKQLLNTPIQGGAAHIINRASIRLEKRTPIEVPSARILGQVHDQLIYEVPQENLMTLARIMKEEMERPVNYPPHGEVKFKVDFETGRSWGELEELEVEPT